MQHLVVDLGDARFDDAARSAIAEEAARRGVVFAVEEPDDATLAWIDLTFGASSWSSEARGRATVVARRAGDVVGFATIAGGALPFRWLRPWIARENGPIFGPFGIAAAERGTGLGALLARRAFGEMRRRCGSVRVLVPAVGGERLRAWYAREAGATAYDGDDGVVPARARTTVLASGNGSNFQAVLDRVARGVLPLDVTALVANDASAYALTRARKADVAAISLPWVRADETRAAYDARLCEAVAATEPELVLLLGWMHLVPGAFLERFPDVVNVHPAFLPFDGARDDVVVPDGTTIPAIRGAHAVRDALAQGLAWFGATAHRVSLEADRGAVLSRVPVRMPGEPTLGGAMGVLRPVEFAVVAAAVRRWFATR